MKNKNKNKRTKKAQKGDHLLEYSVKSKTSKLFKVSGRKKTRLA